MLKRIILAASLLASPPLLAAEIQTFAPRVLQDGSRIWVYTTTVPGPEARLIDQISQHLARAQWCLDGWEITNRTDGGGTLVVEGRCKQERT